MDKNGIGLLKFYRNVALTVLPGGMLELAGPKQDSCKLFTLQNCLRICSSIGVSSGGPGGVQSCMSHQSWPPNAKCI